MSDYQEQKVINETMFNDDDKTMYGYCTVVPYTTKSVEKDSEDDKPKEEVIANPSDTLNKDEKKFFKDKYSSIELIQELCPVLKCVNNVFKKGSIKYGPFKWELSYSTIDSNTLNCCCNAMLRHLALILTGSDTDSESGLPHIHHVACRALMMCSKYVQINCGDTNEYVGVCRSMSICYRDEFDSGLGLIPGTFLISLMKYNGIVEKQHIYRKFHMVINDLKKNKTSKKDRLIIVSRYIATMLMDWITNDRHLIYCDRHDVYNVICNTEMMCIEILMLINYLIEAEEKEVEKK